MDLNTEIFYLINNGLSNHYLDFIMPHVSDAGGFATLSVICLILFVITRKNIFNLGKYYNLVKLCIFSLIIMFLITLPLKLAFNQPRPYLVLEHVNILTSSLDPNSFPSGHTATTVSIVTVLVLKSKDYFKKYKLINCLLIIFALTIGISRIYIGMHYPFDVLAGGVIGMVSGVLACKILKV